MISTLQPGTVLDESKKILAQLETSSLVDQTMISIQAPAQVVVSLKEGVHTITIPRGTQLVEPIVIATSIHLSQQKSRIMIVVEDHAAATILETQRSLKERNSTGEDSEQNSPQYQQQLVTVLVRPSANATYCTLHDTNEHSSSSIVKRGVVGESGSLTWIDLFCGGRLTRFNLQTEHAGKAAQSKAYTLYYGDGEQVFEINTETAHCAEQTSGMMKARGILAGHARVSYKGAVHIPCTGGGAVAQQKSETLLLGDHAHCDALPILDVHHDDVICSHGAAMGRVEEETLFYLISRGLDEEMARRLLLESFFQDYLREVPSQGFLCEIQKTLGERIGRKIK